MRSGAELDTVLEVRGLTKKFGAVTAVQHVSLAAREGEFLAFLGPSGCGKTTLLRMIAGLEDPTAGSILIRGRDVSTLPPYLRDIGMVFQQYALFPHKNVFKNIEFGLRYRSGLSFASRAPRVGALLDLVRLSGFQDRKPYELSGGEQQRVALARALATEPAVLLLDEPLSNLDAKLRAEMRVELKQIHAKVGVTFIYVTHDRSEALSMSDRVVVMRSGLIEQIGTPREVYERPRSEYVARFMGHSNILGATVAQCTEDGAIVTLQGGETVRARGADDLQRGEEVRLVVRPEGVKIRTTIRETEENSSLFGVVDRLVYNGSSLDVSVRLRNSDLVWADVQNSGPLALEAGRDVHCTFSLDATWLLRLGDDGNGQSTLSGTAALRPADDSLQ